MKQFIEELKDGRGLEATGNYNMIYNLDKQDLRTIISELLLALSFEDDEVVKRVTEEASGELKERYSYLYE